MDITIPQPIHFPTMDDFLDPDRRRIGWAPPTVAELGNAVDSPVSSDKALPDTRSAAESRILDTYKRHPLTSTWSAHTMLDSREPRLPGDGYVQPFHVSAYASRSIEHKLDITRSSLARTRENTDMMRADARFRKLTLKADQWYRDVKREANEGEAKFERMNNEQDRYESGRDRGNYLGTESLKDYSSGFDLGLGWERSPYHYNNGSLSDRIAQRKAMEALLPEFRSSMDTMKAVRLQRENEAAQRAHNDRIDAAWLHGRLGAAAHNGREDFKRSCLMSPQSVFNTAEHADVINKNDEREREVSRVRRQQAVEIEARAKREAQVAEEIQMEKLQEQIDLAKEAIVKEKQHAKESTTKARRSLHEAAAKEAQERLPGLQKKLDLLAHQYAMDDMEARSIEDAAKRAEYTPVASDNTVIGCHLQSMSGIDTVASFLIDLDQLEAQIDRFQIKIDADNDGDLTKEEFKTAYMADIELFNDLARLAAKAQALNRKIDHSLALADKITTGKNLERQHEASRKCATLLARIEAMRGSCNTA